MTADRDDLRRIAARLLADSNRTKAETWDSGESARMHDRITVLDAYLAGLDGRVPDALRFDFEDTGAQLKREADPEWADFQRLAAKFYRKPARESEP